MNKQAVETFVEGFESLDNIKDLKARESFDPMQYDIVLGVLRNYLVPKVMAAFGGCEKCYGKGYNSQKMKGKTKINTCVCERGKELDKVLK